MSIATCLLNCNVGDKIHYVRRGIVLSGTVVDKLLYNRIVYSGKDFPRGYYPTIGRPGYQSLPIHPYNIQVVKIIKAK